MNAETDIAAKWDRFSSSDREILAEVASILPLRLYFHHLWTGHPELADKDNRHQLLRPHEISEIANSSWSSLAPDRQRLLLSTPISEWDAEIADERRKMKGPIFIGYF